VVAPATLSILTTTFTEGAERNRALGLWGAMGAVGGASGGLLGGLLTEALSWRWILIVNLPIGVAGVIAALRGVPAAARARGATDDFDIAGALAVTAGLVVLTYGIVGSEEHGWGSTRTLLTLLAGTVLLVAFLVVEQRLARRPLMPLRIFASRALSTANVVVFCLGAAAFAMWYFVTLYLQDVLGYSPIEAGVATLPMPVTIAACTQAATRLTGRLGAGPVLAGGMALIGAGMLLFARVPVDGHFTSDVLAPAVVTAAGIGFSFVPVTIAATGGVEREDAGLASGIVNTSRQMGGSVGLALLATVATQHTAAVVSDVGRAQALTEGFHRAFALGAAFAIAGALVSALVLARGSVTARAARAG
jgi:Na+/melibiose symporter-like transporter